MDLGNTSPEGLPAYLEGKDTVCNVTYVSESGGITADILVHGITILDELDVFPRGSGITPFLLLDGHQSRLDPKFLTYINNHDHRWKVCLGVPYVTSLWQLGDIPKQNGRFKDEWYRMKALLFKYKADYNLDLKITQEDVMPILNRIFAKSYDRVEWNLRVLSERGWNPPNRKLLEHPEVAAEEENNGEEQQSAEQVDYRALNTSSGF